MRRSRTPLTLLAMSVVALSILSPSATPVAAHIPLFVGGIPAKWHPSDLPLTYVIQSDGSDDLSFEAVVSAIREAFTEWSSIDDTTFSFIEDTTSDPSSRELDDSTHIVLFDEDGSSGWLSPNIIAVTPLLAQTSGRIIDADIIVNGRDHTFTTVSGQPGYDLQSIITHEAGHVLGLDHCATIAGTLFPFSTEQTTHVRSLTSDEKVGVRQLYPAGAAFGRIIGNVRRAVDDTAVRGGSVVALDDDGVVVTTGYTDANGNFDLQAVPVDVYHVYVQPLLGPVTADSLSLDPIDTDFATTFFGGNDSPDSVALAAGQITNLDIIEVADGTLQLDAAGPTPRIAPRGSSASLFIGGSGLTGVNETITVTGTGVTTPLTPTFTGTFYSIPISISPTAALGPRSVRISNDSGATALLTGLIEVVDPPPVITSFTPSVADSTGGTELTIFGTGFQSGSKVYVGPVRASDVVVISPNELRCQTPPGYGLVPIQVEGPNSQVAVATSKLRIGYVPNITAVYPNAGSAAGGTPITIAGSGFEEELTLEFNGAAITPEAVEFDAIHITTPPATAGAISIAVTNSTGFTDFAADAFHYVDHDDPTVASVSPAEGTSNGGTLIQVLGSGFRPAVTVRFAVSPDGSEGVIAQSIQRRSETWIEVVAPSLPVGLHNMVVENDDGSKACVLDAYTATPPIASSRSRDGGGVCGAVLPVGRPPTSGEMWGARLPWMVLLALLALSVLYEMRTDRRSRQLAGVTSRK